jgi:hypothetical protein
MKHQPPQMVLTTMGRFAAFLGSLVFHFEGAHFYSAFPTTLDYRERPNVITTPFSNRMEFNELLAHVFHAGFLFALAHLSRHVWIASFHLFAIGMSSAGHLNQLTIDNNQPLCEYHFSPGR